MKQQGGITLQSNALLRSGLITLICTQTTRYGNAVQRSWMFSSNSKELHRFIFELLLQIPGVNQSLLQHLSHITAVKKTCTCFEAKGHIFTTFARATGYDLPCKETQRRSEPGLVWDPATQDTKVLQISFLQKLFNYITLGGCPTLQTLLGAVNQPVWAAGETGGPVTLKSVAWTSS